MMKIRGEDAVQTVGRVQRVEVLSAEVERNEKCWGCHRPVITCHTQKKLFEKSGLTH